MKKQLILLVILTLFIFSCEKNDTFNDLNTQQSQNHVAKNNANARKNVNFKNLNVEIPDYFPNGVLNFKSNDFYNIAMNSSKGSFYKVNHIKGKSLKEIMDNAYKYYPNMNTFDSKEYKKIFPQFTEEQIVDNKEILDEVIEKMMAFDISSAFSQLKDAKYILFENNKNARGYISSFDWLNSACTVAIVVSHPRLDLSGLAQAVNDANSLCFTYGTPTSNGGTNDLADAVRHGIWGIYLGKHGTWRYSDPSNAWGIIYELLAAHECGHSGLGTAMDFHNNSVALKYYSDHVQVTGSWPNRNTRIFESVETIASTIASYQCDLVYTEYSMTLRDNQTLVRIQ